MNCTKCGQEILNTATFCEHCGTEVKETNVTPAGEVQKPENIVTGIVGALIGAALGGGCIILLSQMGMVASISGIVLAICTMKGYELLGGRLSKVGMIVSILLMLATPYIADRLDWAILVMNQATSEGLNWTFGQSFQAFPVLLEEEVIDSSVYWSNLVKLYGFTAIGVVATLAGNKKQKKK